MKSVTSYFHLSQGCQGSLFYSSCHYLLPVNLSFMDIPTQKLIDVRVIVNFGGLLGMLDRVYSCTGFCMDRFSVLLGVHLGVDLPSHNICFAELKNHFPKCLYYLYSHQQCVSIPVSLYPHQHLVIIFIVAIIMAVVFLILVCISLIVIDVERFFHLLTRCLYVFFGEVSTHVFAHF